jgi:hypothetical protein
MMKRLLLSLILLVLLIPGKAQEFIGLPEKTVKAVMAKDFPGLTPDNMVRNNIYRYLKYHSADDNETWLIFLDEKGRCTGVRITYSNNLYDAKIRELNEKYGNESKGTWSYRTGKDLITVKVQRDAWFFTVTHVGLYHM